MQVETLSPSEATFYARLLTLHGPALERLRIAYKTDARLGSEEAPRLVELLDIAIAKVGQKHVA